MRRPLSPIEHQILKTVVQGGRFMTTREVAMISGVSWNTASRYLKYFNNKGWISRKTVGNRVYWRARV